LRSECPVGEPRLRREQVGPNQVMPSQTGVFLSPAMSVPSRIAVSGKRQTGDTAHMRRCYRISTPGCRALALCRPGSPGSRCRESEDADRQHIQHLIDALERRGLGVLVQPGLKAVIGPTGGDESRRIGPESVGTNCKDQTIRLFTPSSSEILRSIWPEPVASWVFVTLLPMLLGGRDWTRQSRPNTQERAPWPGLAGHRLSRPMSSRHTP
jgi:hypothetical protein